MKKAICITLVYAILMTMLVFAPFTANADEKNIVETGDTVASGTTGDCTWKIEGTKLTISGNGKTGSYDNCDDNTAPWRIYDITEAVIEKGVTTIGKHAFYECDKLTKVSIPDTVRDIGISAFSVSSSLTSVTIPDSVTSIGSDAFSGCTSLTSVTIPDSVTSIGDSMFFGCTSLTSVTIPDSVVSIGSNAFGDCSSLTSVMIPDYVTKIKSEAFYGCSSLKSVTIPDSVTSIGSFAFYGCSNLTSISIGKSVTKIDSNAFYSCEKLSSVTIPASVYDIHNNAFGYYDVVGGGYDIKIEGFTIYGYTDTAAERYAESNCFNFVSLDEQPTEPETKQIKGDIDGDGKVSIVDTTVIQRYLAGLETAVEGIGEPIE